MRGGNYLIKYQIMSRRAAAGTEPDRVPALLPEGAATFEGHPARFIIRPFFHAGLAAAVPRSYGRMHLRLLCDSFFLLFVSFHRRGLSSRRLGSERVELMVTAIRFDTEINYPDRSRCCDQLRG